ncbi:MAG: UDP-3-O-(3-hydroxymyristoyl)glucosamine N-acyltransferase [Burkholderiales bacterium]
MPDTGLTLAELASRVAAKLDGDGAVIVRRVGTIENAADDAITFLVSRRLRSHLHKTRAAAVIVTPADADATPLPKLLHANPYATYARVAAILHAPPPVAAGVHAMAVVGEGAAVDPSAAIGPFAVVGARARIGARAVIAAHASVGNDCTIGDDVRVYPHATIYARCVVGPRSIVHSGAVIGADGFGMAEESGRWIKIPQVGRVVIGADCEIGANTTIDRGAIDDTVIEDDVKLDNQIQVGHNCRIGAHTAIAGCVGIAGSATIGRNVKIGGAAMIAGHLSIADNVVISAATGVFTSINAPGVFTGTFPALPHRDWQHVASQVRRLRLLADRVTALERAVRSSDDGDAEGEA